MVIHLNLLAWQDPLLKGQRCVILADGFYEWRRQDKDKQPFFIYFPQSKQPLPGSSGTQCDDAKQECLSETQTTEEEEVSFPMSAFIF